MGWFMRVLCLKECYANDRLYKVGYEYDWPEDVDLPEGKRVRIRAVAGKAVTEKTPEPFFEVVSGKPGVMPAREGGPTKGPPMPRRPADAVKPHPAPERVGIEGDAGPRPENPDRQRFGSLDKSEDDEAPKPRKTLQRQMEDEPGGPI